MATPARIVRPVIQPSNHYYDTRPVGKNAKRWVFTAGDTVIPQRKRELTALALGGEETSCWCLQKYGRGFVPRGLAAILETGGDPMPMEHMGDLRAAAWSGMSLNPELVKRGIGFIPVFPADGLDNLRRYVQNSELGPRGLDEIRVLAGKEWEECHNGYSQCARGHFRSPVGQPMVANCPECNEPLVLVEGDGILDVLERAMFGDGMEPTLRGLADQVRHVKVDDIRIDVGSYQADALRMCDEFRNWGEGKMSMEHSQLRQGTKADWTFSYSPLAEMLLVQLEMTRQDQPLAEMSHMVSRLLDRPIAAAQPAFDPNEFERRMEARFMALREQDQARIAELEAAQSKVSEEVEVYTCEHCGEEVNVKGKGIHLGVHCKTLHPKTTE